MFSMRKLYKLQNKNFYKLFAEAALGLLNKDQKVFYVDANDANASDSEGNPGTSISSPLATLSRAHTLATSGKGDIIVVLPTHTENILVNYTFSKSNVRFIGLESGNQRPTLTYTAAAGAITISGDNVEFKGFNVTTLGVIDVATPFVVSGDRVLFGDIEMVESAATSQFVYGVLFTGDDCVCDGFKFRGAAGDANVTAIRHTEADQLEIKNCDLVGNFQGSADATGAIQCLTTESTDLRIHHNILENRDGTSEAGIVFTAACTGLVYENFIAVPTGDFAQGLINDDAVRQYNNYVVDVAQERGAPVGTASA